MDGRGSYREGKVGMPSIKVTQRLKSRSEVGRRRRMWKGKKKNKRTRRQNGPRTRMNKDARIVDPTDARKRAKEALMRVLW
jgi:hypothetical protein